MQEEEKQDQQKEEKEDQQEKSSSSESTDIDTDLHREKMVTAKKSLMTLLCY